MALHNSSQYGKELSDGEDLPIQGIWRYGEELSDEEFLLTFNINVADKPLLG